MIRDDPVAAMPTVLEAVQFIVEHPDEMAAADPSPADAQLRDQPEVLAALVAMTREGLRAGPHGSAFDVVTGSREDPLPLDRVRVPVQLWYGEEDPIGVEHGRWYADRFTDATLTVVPGAGHLLPLEHWREILDRGRAVTLLKACLNGARRPGRASAASRDAGGDRRRCCCGRRGGGGRGPRPRQGRRRHRHTRW